MKRLIAVIELLLILTAAACAAFLGFYFYQSRTAKTEIEEIRQQVKEQPELVDYTQNRGGIVDAYYDLYNQNNDFAGWIKIPGTPIDYPVMQAEDNEFYLHKDFHKEYKYSGMPFVDYRCDLSAPCTNVIVYAHNMKDGSMFAALSRYEEREFYERNKGFTFNTLYMKGEYAVIAAFYITPEEFPYHDFIDAYTREPFDEYVAKAKSLSLYDTGEGAEYGEYLLTLSTCAYNSDDERFVVVAKKIN